MSLTTESKLCTTLQTIIVIVVTLIRILLGICETRFTCCFLIRDGFFSLFYYLYILSRFYLVFLYLQNYTFKYLINVIFFSSSKMYSKKKPWCVLFFSYVWWSISTPRISTMYNIIHNRYLIHNIYMYNINIISTMRVLSTACGHVDRSRGHIVKCTFLKISEIYRWAIVWYYQV